MPNRLHWKEKETSPPKLNAKRNVQESTAPKVGGKKKPVTKTGQTKV